MNTSLQKIFNALENQKAALLKAVSGLSDEKLNYKSRPDRWSINQIFIHLLTAKRSSVNYIKKKSAGVENLDNSGLTEMFKSVVLTISQRLPFLKFKEPKIIASATPREMSHLEIIEEWNNVRKEMKDTLDRIADTDVQKKSTNIPLSDI